MLKYLVAFQVTVPGMEHCKFPKVYVKYHMNDVNNILLFVLFFIV